MQRNIRQANRGQRDAAAKGLGKGRHRAARYLESS
jgi:hypothetical protein